MEDPLNELFSSGKKWISKPEHLLRAESYFSSLPNSNDVSLELHEKICIGLSLCLESAPNLWRFAKHYLSKENPPFKRFLKVSEENEEPPSKKNKTEIKSFSDELILESCLHFLDTHKYFHKLWHWDQLINVSKVLSIKSKWLIVECLARVNNWSPDDREKFFQHLSKDGQSYNSISLEYFITKNLSKVDVDQVPVGVVQHVQERVVVVEGRHLLRDGDLSENEKESKFVNVQSREKLLRRMVEAIGQNKPVMLEGSMGCGKTKLVEYLARLAGRREFQRFHRVYMSDRTDGRSLVGGYTCHDVPGHFSWEDGILTRAAKFGDWLLIEDIHLAPSDVMSTLLPLIERGQLHVPSKGLIVEASPGFQLFLTQRCDGGGKMLTVKGTCRINVEDFRDEELTDICSQLYPTLENVATKMVACFAALRSRQNSSDFSARKRLFSIRDLKKWSRRCWNMSQMDNETIVLEGLDCFCNHLPSSSSIKMDLIRGIGQMFNLTQENIEHLAIERFPGLNKTRDAIKIGRTNIVRKYQVENSSRRPFYLTRQASRLLEFLSSSINNREPILLVGETGVGKTSAVQFLSDLLGKKLVTVNLNQQTESSDLLGGFKPVDFEHFVLPVRQRFESLFRQTFSSKENAKFMSHMTECHVRKRWSDLVQLMIHACKGALQKGISTKEWMALDQQLDQLKRSVTTQAKLLFSFVNGALTDAIQNGQWILLDEINMADTEVLECLSEVMNTEIDSVCLYGGSEKLITKHPDFQVFACMNPATDVGKKELPDGLRNRFTEFFIEEPQSEQDLLLIVQDYLKNLAPPLDLKIFKQVVKFFFAVRQLAEKKLMDGTGHKPTYSLRTLCRALDIAAQNFCQNPKRSLLEAFLMCFLTELDRSSYPVVFGLVLKHFGKGEAVTTLKSPIMKPPTGFFVNIEGYWLTAGEKPPAVPEDFILTETVRQNLKDVARIVSLSKFAVLLQGETSVGKTSLITYLSKASGNVCLRINNHEHTDIQEYVGAYCMDQQGNFTFQEGVLARAMRLGYWIILDELNLAPSDVLEALNRVLDDNRELFVSETQTLIKAHPSFRIFATQNPSGSSYGGRKTLSRAFRNRFVELHFNELPSSELSIIIEKRGKISTKASKKLISVMQELQMARKSSAALEGKRGFLTLRDLFRWADRCSLADQPTQFYDWERHFAEEGFLVLASKIRVESEIETVKKCLEKIFKRDISPADLYSLSESNNTVTRNDVLAILKSSAPEDIVWTQSAARMAVITLHSLRFKEPVLLVGETGCGKTQICQTLARVLARALLTVNCHLNTESSDFLGGLRPNRNITEGDEALFQWVDGPLVDAMTQGSILLVDEVSLADDSVLERMNSILEHDRTLFLIEETSSAEFREIVAHRDFQFVATMNPGGDFGKKELSPALRNRLVEIWCPSETSKDDLSLIVRSKLNSSIGEKGVEAIIEFVMWYRTTNVGNKVPFTLRDLLGWILFVNQTHSYLSVECSLIHGICLVIFDGLGSVLTGEPLSKIKEFGQKFFETFLADHNCDCFKWITSTGTCSLINSEHEFKIGQFRMDKQVATAIDQQKKFHFGAPTVGTNTLKILRALQIENKAVLLEGLPSAGKSSLVDALAKMTGNTLVRINLSDQTEISDLFGADLPTESGSSIASFSWHDGPFLSALKSGHWILLDELNLATQSVLEGLNACLDHRGTVFIPELNRSFEISHNQTRIFGCQNPPREGGDRKNLPKSFLNRFFKVYLSELSPLDLVLICRNQYPELQEDLVRKMVGFASQLHRDACIEKNWGYSGSPWQFNLRDLLRWCQAASNRPNLKYRFAELIFMERFRMECDRDEVCKTFSRLFENNSLESSADTFHITKEFLRIGSAVLKRSNQMMPSMLHDYRLLHPQLKALESLMLCVEYNWMPILVGGPDAGKSSLVNILSDLVGHPLQIITLTTASDTSELLGGFEQTGPYEKRSSFVKQMSQQLLLDIEANQDNFDAIGSLVRIRMKLQDAENEGLELETLEAILDEYQIVAKSSQDWKGRLKSLEQEGKISFEWMDSILVRAVTNGDWLMLDDANSCNSAVLDRLNSLLEPGGVLAIGERGCSSADGKIPTVVPHPNFRLFLTINPANGELSPAIRNRGVEIFIESSLLPNVKQACAVRHLAAYPTVMPILRQKKLLEELCHSKGLYLSIVAKWLLIFASPEDLDSRQTLIVKQFKLHHPEMFEHLRSLLSNDVVSNGIDSRQISLRDDRGSNDVAAYLEATFAMESVKQTPAQNFASLTLDVKQLWSLLVMFASKLFQQVRIATANHQILPDAEDVLVLMSVSNLFQTMRSKLDKTTVSDKSIMKEWSIEWLRLKTLSTQSKSNILLAQEVCKEEETEIGTWLKPYFSAFNLLVRQFWSVIGLPPVRSETPKALDDQKTFLGLTHDLSLANKPDFVTICLHIAKMKTVLANPSLEALTKIGENQDGTRERSLTVDDQFRLQFILVSAWNAYFKNRLSLLCNKNKFTSSVLFPVDALVEYRSLEKATSERWSVEKMFTLKAMASQQFTIIQHIFKRIGEELAKDELKESSAIPEEIEVQSLTQLIHQVLNDKRDFSDTQLLSCYERNRQLKALQLRLVADYNIVVSGEGTSKDLEVENTVSQIRSTLNGILEISCQDQDVEMAETNLGLDALASSAKAALKDSDIFPKHLQLSLPKVLETISSEIGRPKPDPAILRLCSGLLLLHISSELGCVDISEHLAAKAEAMESEITSITVSMMAEDSCRLLSKVEEPLPVSSSQSDRRQLMGKHVEDQVSNWKTTIATIPKRHPVEPFDALVQDLNQLKQSLLSVENVLTLSDELKHGNATSCIDKILSWQQSLSKFMGQFRANYSSYPDISVPVLAGVTDIMAGLWELKCRRSSPGSTEAFDYLRYLLSEIECLPERNLDLFLVSDTINSTLASDVLRDLGKFWILKQQETADKASIPEDSIIFRFRREDAEQTAERLGGDYDAAAAAVVVVDERQCQKMLRDLLKRFDNRQDLDEFKREHFKATYYRLMKMLTASPVSISGKENGQLYHLHCQAIASSLTSKSKEIEKLRPLLDEMKSFINENVAPYNEEHPVLESIVRMIDDIMKRSLMEAQKSFLIPLEKLVQTLLEWNKHVPRNQIIPHRELTRLIINWRKSDLTWQSIRDEIDDHLLLEINDCALALWPLIEEAIVGKSGSTKKSLCAPFVLFFTSAFTGDFNERIRIIEKLTSVFKSVNPEVVRILQTVIIYFRSFAPCMEVKIVEKLKKLKPKFEVARKAGKIFEEEKMRLHFKETAKVRRDTILQILKVLKEPAMRYTASRPAPEVPTSPQNLESEKLFKSLNLPSAQNCDDVVFTSEKGMVLGGIKELGDKCGGLIRQLDSNFKQKLSAGEDLDTKFEQLVALQAELKRPPTKDKKCAFHPTQKAIGNMLADLREMGLRPLYGARFDLRTIHLLSELFVPLENSSSAVEQITYFMFRFEELKESFYSPEKCAKAFPTCQKGYDQLTHGMLQVIKLQRSLVKATEGLSDIKNTITSFVATPKPEIECWTKFWARTLKRLGTKSSQIAEILGNLPDGQIKNYFQENDLEVSTLKKESEKICTILSEYSKWVELLQGALGNETNLFENGLDLLEENFGKLDKLVLKLFQNHQEMSAGVLATLTSEHREAVTSLETFRTWMKNLPAKNPLPAILMGHFETNLKSVGTRCLLALQETSKCIKKFQNDESGEDSGFLISTIDRTVAGIKSLDIPNLLSCFNALTDFVDLCKGRGFDVEPLLQVVHSFSPILESYFNCAQVLVNHSETLLTMTCHYLSQCAHVMKTFLLYDFGKLDQEEGKEGELSGEISGTGLGDGQANEATTNDLESEDIFEGAEKPQKPEDETEKEEDETTKEEDGVEMSGDLDGQMQDKEEDEKDPGDESDDQPEDEEEMLENEEGETDQDKGLDEQVWNDEGEEEKEEEKELNKEKRETDDQKEKKNDPRGDSNPEQEEDENQPKNQDQKDEEKRERKDDEGVEEEGAEELEMKDGIFGDENNEPPEPEDLELPDDLNMDDNEEGEDDDPSDMEVDPAEERLPDFADAKDEEVIEDDEKTEMDDGNEEPAGHDRQDSNNVDESSKNPLTTDKDDDKQEEQKKDEGTEFDGLQDEDGRGDLNKIDNVDNNEKEKPDEQKEDHEAVEEDPAAIDEEEKAMESTETIDKVEQKVLTEEMENEEEGSDKGKMEQLFSHTKDVEKCTEKTVDRANEDQIEDNQMDVDENDQEDKENKSENLNHHVRKFEEMELVETEIVPRGDETIFSTNENFQNGPRMNGSTQVEIRTQFRKEITSNELKEWLELCGSVHDLSQSLTEQLRLILEPTKATKFRGDFKSGKKLNMRKIIPFIASNYRKDKIWLRRTKPSKRDYYVMVAVDDSSSMNVNEVKRTAYQSLATLCQALSTLEVGKFGIVSFGNEPRLVQPLQNNFAHEDGAHLLKTLTFEQTATNVSKMLDVAHKSFAEAERQGDAAKLLLVLSDGRGIFNEGQEKVLASVRNVLLANIFVIFVIIENPNNKDSVLDMRMATFDENNKPTIVSYMEQFPFPYYMILKNVNSLPQSLSDALRQWFAYVAN